MPEGNGELTDFTDPWPREFDRRLRRASDELEYWQEHEEPRLVPDQRLDEVGDEIAFYLLMRGVPVRNAIRQAMDGNLRQRRRVRDDHLLRLQRDLEYRKSELDPRLRRVSRVRGPIDQLDFWSARLSAPEFIYFIQREDTGAVKIGLSKDPTRRLATLQTGNEFELKLRHLIPGGLPEERQLHQRFAPARIRGEWFGGPAYLSMILMFGEGLSREMVVAHDGGSAPPELRHGRVWSTRKIELLRVEIERLWHRSLSSDAIADYLDVPVEDVRAHLRAMTEDSYYDVAWSWDPWLGETRYLPGDELARWRHRRKLRRRPRAA